MILVKLFIFLEEIFNSIMKLLDTSQIKYNLLLLLKLLLL